MAYQRIIYEKVDPEIVKVSMNRPEKRNAQDDLMQWEIQDAFTEADLDEEVRVIIFAGVGKDFSSGHDMSGMKWDGGLREEAPKGSVIQRTVASKLTGMEYNLQREQHIYLNQCRAMRNVSKPTIAMIQGNCMAGAWMSAAMCDLIITSDDAKFGDPVVRMGPAAVEILFHPYDLGFRKAKEILWTGDPITAQEGKELGFVSQVVPREKLEEETLALARRIAMNMPVAVSLVKRSINQAWDEMGQRNAWHYHLLIHQLSHASDERMRWNNLRAEAIEKGGVKEFLKVRDAKFKAGGRY